MACWMYQQLGHGDFKSHTVRIGDKEWTEAAVPMAIHPDPAEGEKWQNQCTVGGSKKYFLMGGDTGEEW